MTCKKRKLQYIREKNHYRSGGEGRNYIKISREMLEDSDFIPHLIVSCLSKMEKTFKMKLALKQYALGWDGDDFVKDIQTLRYSFKKVD
tara:strand:+ start:462 stop:728 length:267 start_codon:yes stop_codon:yes gene_type:complete